MKESLLFLILVAPSFVSKIINEYIYAYSTGEIDSIAPLDIKKMRRVIVKQITVEKGASRGCYDDGAGPKRACYKLFQSVHLAAFVPADSRIGTFSAYPCNPPAPYRCVPAFWTAETL